MPDKGNIDFQKIEKYNIEVGSVLNKPRRIILFRSAPYEHMEHIPNTNVILIGQNTAKELHRLMTDYGRPTVSEMIPGGIPSSTYTAIRRYLGLSK